MDLLFLLISAVVFLLSCGLIRLCARLSEGGKP